MSNTIFKTKPEKNSSSKERILVQTASSFGSKTIAIFFIATLFFLGAGTLYRFYEVYSEYIGELHDVSHLIKAMTFRQPKGSDGFGNDVATPSTLSATTGQPEKSQAQTVQPQISFYRAFCCKVAKNATFVKRITFNIEDVYTRYFFGLPFFVDHYGQFMKGMGARFVYKTPENGIYRNDENFLFPSRVTPFLTDKTFSPESLRSQIDGLIQLNSFCNEQKIQFLIIKPPVRDFALYSNLSPSEQRHKSKSLQERDEFIHQLNAASVPCYDTEKALREKGVDVRDWYYRTDHHWRIETVFRLLPDMLNALDFDFAEDETTLDALFSARSFKTITFKRFFIGSTGREVGRYFVPPDDFTYFVPLFPTEIYKESVHRVTHELIKNSGSFDEVMIWKPHLNSSDVYANRYGVYGGFDTPISRTTFENAPIRSKVLVIKDSFAGPLCGLLPALVRHLVIVDPRYYHDKTIEELIESEKPDIVILCRS